MNDNNKQSRKESTASFFNQVASNYDRIGPRLFSYFGRRLAEMAQIAEKASVLDIASGRGAALFPAAEQTGPHGHVTGIDFSEEMVRETSAEITALNLKNVDMLQMDAEQMSFPDDSFDIALCGFAMFLFSDSQQVFGEFIRVLKPGGRIGMTVFTEGSKYFQWFDEMISSFMQTKGPQEIEIQKSYGPKLFTSSELKETLNTAGFKEINIVKEESDFTYKDEHEFWSSLSSHGARRFLDQLNSEMLESFKSYFYEQIQDIKKSDGIHMPNISVLYAFGRNPSP